MPVFNTRVVVCCAPASQGGSELAAWGPAEIAQIELPLIAGDFPEVEGAFEGAEVVNPGGI